MKKDKAPPKKSKKALTDSEASESEDSSQSSAPKKKSKKSNKSKHSGSSSRSESPKRKPAAKKAASATADGAKIKQFRALLRECGIKYSIQGLKSMSEQSLLGRLRDVAKAQGVGLDTSAGERKAMKKKLELEYEKEELQRDSQRLGGNLFTFRR